MMKRICNYFTMMVVALSALFFTACDSDDDGYKGPVITLDDVKGSYNGVMRSGKTGDVLEDTVLVQASGEQLAVTGLPVRAIVRTLVGAEQVDAVVEAVGEVNYSMNYEAVLTTDQGNAVLTLKPGEFTFDMPVDEAVKQVKVQFVADSKGVFTGINSALSFNLKVEKIWVDEEEITGTEAVEYAFLPTQKAVAEPAPHIN